MQTKTLSSFRWPEITPGIALVVARIIAALVFFFVSATIVISVPGMLGAAWHRGFHFATFGALLIGLLLLCAISILPAVSAFGLWLGRRWAWWLQFALMILAILRFPRSGPIAALFIVALVVIRDGYFRTEQRISSQDRQPSDSSAYS